MMLARLSPLTLLAGLTIAGLGATGARAWFTTRPSHDRDWQEVHARMPRAEFDGPRVTIRDVRAFEWPSGGGEPVPRWEDRTYDLAAVSSVWYVLTPFSTDWRGPAHAFLSFGFDDGRYLAISVEARRERGEEYSMRRGLLKGYELTYVIGDERDLIGSRVLHQRDDVFVYPGRATREAARALLVAMLERANALAEQPEFYGTLRRNCTTAILDHVNSLAERPIRYGPRILLPGYSDVVALRHGLLDTDLPIEEARRRFRVDERAAAGEAADFSRRIRG